MATRLPASGAGSMSASFRMSIGRPYRALPLDGGGLGGGDSGDPIYVYVNDHPTPNPSSSGGGERNASASATYSPSSGSRKRGHSGGGWWANQVYWRLA